MGVFNFLYYISIYDSCRLYLLNMWYMEKEFDVKVESTLLGNSNTITKKQKVLMENFIQIVSGSPYITH
jgi:hypothetical protein